jgi:hypothetical protein
VRKLQNLSSSLIEEAVEKTLLYYKLFNSGISLVALHPMLLDMKVSRTQLDDAINSLLVKGIVAVSDDTIYLKKEIGSFYVRKNKTLEAGVIKRSLNLLNKVPFVSAIAFSGGTANYGIENHEDIDLFIITKPFTVYIVYFIIHIASLLLKSRNILCINYLIDEKEIQIRLLQDMFTAHQIVALKPFKNENIMHHFLSSNDWISTHFPNYFIPERQDHKSSALYLFFKPFNLILKSIYRLLYKKYVRSTNKDSVILSEHIIKLHTNDYHFKVMDEFQNQWKKYVIEKQNVSFT